MGAARRWKLLPFRSSSFPLPKPPKPKPSRVLDVLATPSTPPPSKEEDDVEEVPGEFLCPVLRLPMADPVVLPSGTTYERACVRACAELGMVLGPDGAVVAGDATAEASGGIPNDALRAAIRKWCARSGRAPPVPPSVDEAREAVLRAAPVRSVSNLSSCSTSRPSAASTSSSSSSSSAGSSSAEMAAAAVEVEVGVVRVKDAADAEVNEIEEELTPPEEAEEEAWARSVEHGTATEVEAAMASLRRATRESAARRRALCTPRVLAALLSPRHYHRSSPAARADAAAALANLAIEPENRVPIVRAGAVPALIDALVSPSSPPEAREHAAGALFGLALHEGNRAAVGVLGAVPPLLAVFSDCDDADLPPRARRDAGMALYHLSLAAVNQSKLARGGVRTLLAVASEPAEPALIRRLALMVACNVAACAEGRDALMNAGAVAATTAILSEADNNTSNPDLQHWCVAALYGMSRDNARRFRGLARAAGADRPLMLVVERAIPCGVGKEMAQTVLRVISGDDGDVPDGESHSGIRPQRRRASWAAAPPAAAATPPSAHQWRSVCID